MSGAIIGREIRFWSGLWPIAATMVFTAVTIWFILPPTVIVGDDDFGYVRSVVETIQRGRPWTDDWLEPWAASLSVLSAVLFKLTGSFHFAIYGLQALLAGGIIGVSAVLLHRRRLPVFWSLAWSLVFLTTPTVLFKATGFGAIPLYVFCLLLAIWAAECGRWSWFAVAWLVALSSRQSALLWLALPVGALLVRPKANWREWGKALLFILLVVIGGCLAYLTIQHGMNQTNARVVMQQGLFSNFHWPGGFQQAGVTLALAVVAMGLAGFVLRVSCPSSPGEKPLAIRSAATLVILILWAVDIRKFIVIEHGLLHDLRGACYLSLTYALALIGWCFGRFQIKMSCVIAVVAMVGLMALRNTIWDYYLIDVALLGFFGVWPLKTTGSVALGKIEIPWLAGGMVALLAFVGFHQAFVVRTKTLVDENYAMISLCERALRSGQAAITELSVASFGHRGWNLYPYFFANDGAGRYIADFDHYVHPNASRFHIGDPAESPASSANGKLRVGEKLLESEVMRRGWFQQRRYNLILTGTAQEAELTLNPERYVRPTFPLNDGEWRDLLRE